MKRIGNELHCIKHDDPGHGWLGVKIAMVRESGAAISPFSYQRGKMAYLEEDCDAPAFIKAIEAKGYKVFVDFRHTDKRSPIRSYVPFMQCCDKAVSNADLLKAAQDSGKLIIVHVGDK